MTADILKLVNYRTGFRRFYAVAVICWTVLVLVALSREEINFAGFLVLVFGPALGAYLLFFIALPWIVEGFHFQDDGRYRPSRLRVWMARSRKWDPKWRLLTVLAALLLAVIIGSAISPAPR